MNSYERVRKTLEFAGPDRIPLAKGKDADIAMVGYDPVADFHPTQDGENEWGVVWTSLNKSQGDQGQVAAHPLADWDAAATYQFPDPYANGRFERARTALPQQREEGRFVFGNLGKGPMHLLDDLRGFAAYLTDLALEPARIEWLLDGIFSVLTGLVRQFAELKVDGIFLADDQAMQTGPIFSMELWRHYLKPRYRDLFNAAHERGLFVYMHTCGNLSEHLIDLHEAGVDMIDNKQPALWMDCPAMSQVRGKLAFSSCLDIQSVMQQLSIDQIDAEVRRLVQCLATPEGGFMGTWYNQPDLNIDQQKNERMIQAYGRLQYG